MDIVKEVCTGQYIDSQHREKERQKRGGAVISLVDDEYTDPLSKIQKYPTQGFMDLGFCLFHCLSAANPKI